MIIEINTSSLRKGHEQTMPGKELLEIYKNNGGRYVTIGSDAHYMEAKELLKEVGLQEVIYRQRRRQIV